MLHPEKRKKDECGSVASDAEILAKPIMRASCACICMCACERVWARARVCVLLARVCLSVCACVCVLGVHAGALLL